MRSRRTYLKVLVNLGIMLILLLVFIFVVPRVIIVSPVLTCPSRSP